MARYINGQPANTADEIRAAMAKSGGEYNEVIEGDYVEHKTVANTSNSSSQGSSSTKSRSKKANYVERLSGKHIIVHDDGTTEQTDKKSGWFD